MNLISEYILRRLAVATVLAATTVALAARRPDVILIAVDDLNDWIGALAGHPQVQTPHMDRLAERGVLFANAHCQAPLCNPSRTSLLTGLRPGTTGIYGLSPWFRSVPELKHLTSLPQAFKNAGYRTAIGGKVFHGAQPPEDDRPVEADDFGPNCTFGPRPEEKLVETPQPHPLVDWGVFPERDEQQNDYEIASWAVNYLKAPENQSADSPLFLAVGFGRPHLPCFASRIWFDLYPEETLQLPPYLESDRDDTPRSSWYLHWRLPEPRLKFLKEANQWKNLVRSYLACVSFVDSMVGRVLDGIKASGRADNTIIVLWSDHGWHLGEKDITGKNTLWERSTHVPLIFAGPGIAVGRSNQPVELLDIYPTLVELCQLPHPGHILEGHSLRPQLVDPAAPRPWPAITTHNPGNHAVRTRDWRYIQYADGARELYNLRDDPNEWRNLARVPGHQAKITELASMLPRHDLPPAPGSRHRVLCYRDGVPNWEGEDIHATDAIPEM